jgi:hypothetical protein
MSGAGDFWDIEAPDVRVRGMFTARETSKSEVTLEGGLKPDPRVIQIGAGVAFSADEDRSVEAMRPITLAGQLDSGELVTLLEARNFGGDGQFGFPQYQAAQVVVGALVAGPGQHYRSLRFRFDDPRWLAHLRGGESAMVADDGSTIRIEADAGGNWIVYESTRPMTLRDLRSRVELGCEIMAQLVLDADVTTAARQVKIDENGPWLNVFSRGRYGRAAAEPAAPEETLLSSQELTIARLAAWIEINDGLDGLASAVVEPLTGVLQLQAQAVSSLVEGIHRRLPYKQFHIDPDGNTKRFERIMRAAKDAAEAQAEKEGFDKALVRRLVGQSVSHFWQVGFADRSTEVVSIVGDAVPEIVESLTGLPGQLKKARNEMAHHLQLDESKEPLPQRYLRYMVVITITPWLLRGLLLLHAGIDADRVHQAYVSHQRFQFARANVAEFVAELGWPLPQLDPCPRCTAGGGQSQP